MRGLPAQLGRPYSFEAEGVEGVSVPRSSRSKASIICKMPWRPWRCRRNMDLTPTIGIRRGQVCTLNSEDSPQALNPAIRALIGLENSTLWRPRCKLDWRSLF